MSSGLLASLSASSLGVIFGAGLRPLRAWPEAGRPPRAQHKAGRGRMDMSRHASPEARKYPPTSLHNDLVEVLPLQEFASAVMVLPLLVAGDSRYPLPEVYTYY